jgi:hypothetical protein
MKKSGEQSVCIKRTLCTINNNLLPKVHIVQIVHLVKAIFKKILIINTT